MHTAVRIFFASLQAKLRKKSQFSKEKEDRKPSETTNTAIQQYRRTLAGTK